MTKVLDHGYVDHIESWGSDQGIIEAARMSTDKGFEGWGTAKEPGDEKLLRYLYEHKHESPFEMAGMTIQVQAPIFVFREWHRHRTQSYNEMSGRYSVLPDLYYIPTVERMLASRQSTTNKQGSEEGLIFDKAVSNIARMRRAYSFSRSIYETMIQDGVSREVARMCLPVAQYSRMRASANLRNWLAFLTLRMDKAAQWEIRQFANIVGNLIQFDYPRTWDLFVERRNR